MEQVRLDVWLDVACLYKTRSEAKRACEAGKVEIGGDRAKPHRVVREGDALVISRPAGRRQTVVVRGLGSAHMKKADARLLYEDTTPPPTPEQIEMRRVDRAYQAAAAAAGGNRRHRREVRRRKESGDW